MWALRRASNPIKNRVFCIRTFQAFSYAAEENAAFTVPYQSDQSPSFKRFYSNPHISLKTVWWGHNFSSKSGIENEEDNDLRGIFNADESVNELISETEVPDTEKDVGEQRNGRNKPLVALCDKITAARVPVRKALDKWVEEGNDMSRTQIALTMLNVRSRRLYANALQFSEWLESTKHLDFTERDYACRLDLIARVHGLPAAENYIENIPNSFRGEIIYRTLLTICVAAQDVTRAEQLFEKMKRTLKFPISSFIYNQLLLLYKKTDKRKIADILLLMDKENIKCTRDTYRILIDAKGLSNDISGMDQIFDTMKAEGIKPDGQTQTILANHYVSSGLNERAEVVLKEMERENPKRSQLDFGALFPLYAALGKPDEVARLWKICQMNPRLVEYEAVIEAWGKLNKIEEAEEVFDEMSKRGKRPHVKYYLPLLKVYGDHKMLAKGIDLVKKMKENRKSIGPSVWDVLVKLYVEAGEVKKAEFLLWKAAKENKMKPYFSSYVTIMEEYANRGDLHNTIKIFTLLGEAGYVAMHQQYHALEKAYRNAKSPAYGERG